MASKMPQPREGSRAVRNVNLPLSKTGGPLPSYSLAAINADNFRPRWLIRGIWSHPSHGELAGMEKTLKSWLVAAMAISVASGRPFLGHFEVQTQGPVVIFTGESGRHLCERRLRHLGRSLGLSAAEIDVLPIRIIDECATTRSEVFKAALERDLEREPVLVILDPLYAYHGADINAGNIHASAEVLNAVSNLTDEAGASLVIVNHFRKSAEDHLSLVSISQAGHREWSESWALVGHKRAPAMSDVHSGHFQLEIVVGGRQWDGDGWSLEADIGKINRDTWKYEGEVNWKVDRRSAPTLVALQEAILAYLKGKDGKPVKVAELRHNITGKNSEIRRPLKICQ